VIKSESQTRKYVGLSLYFDWYNGNVFIFLFVTESIIRNSIDVRLLICMVAYIMVIVEV